MSIEKSQDAYRTITEVSQIMEIPQHVLRFWESKFTQIKPLKRGGGRRYYNPQDVDLLRGIKHLLYDEGYTIKGVQKIIKEQGIRAVIASTQQNLNEHQQTASSSTPHGDEEIEIANPTLTNIESDNLSESFETATSAGSMKNGFNFTETDPEDLPKDVLPENPEETQAGKSSLGFLGLLRTDGKKAPNSRPDDKVLAKKDVELLQDTLYELLECMRILDSTR